jgi:hypothetical protein
MLSDSAWPLAYVRQRTPGAMKYIETVVNPRRKWGRNRNLMFT